MKDFQVKIGNYYLNGEQIFVDKCGVHNFVKWEQTFEFCNEMDGFRFAVNFAKTFGERAMVIAVYYKNDFIEWYCGEPIIFKKMMEES